MSLRRCARCGIVVRYLLRQYQSQTWRPVRFLGLQETWDLSSAEKPGLWPRDHNLNPAVNPAFNMRNGFIHFFDHESTQSGEYDLGLLDHHPINREEKQRKMFPLVVETISALVLIDFYHQAKNLSIPSGFQVSASEYPNLTSMIASLWLYHRPRSQVKSF